MRLNGHTGTIHDVSFSPDGHLLATGAADNTLRIWEIETGLESLAPIGHKGNVYAVACSPTEPVVATGARNKIRLFDLHTGQQRGDIDHRHSVYRLQFSPDGRHLASGGNGDRLHVFDAKTGRAVGAGDWQAGDILAIAYSPDGSLIAVASADKRLKVYDAAPVECRLEMRTSSPVHDLAFSADGSWLLAGDAGGELRVWDPTTGASIQMGPPSRPIHAVSTSSTGPLLATAGAGPAIDLWNHSSRVHEGAIPVAAADTLALDFAPSGTSIAAGGSDDTVHLFPIG
ncbi:MAG: WD40 repeat domain-containing protein [Actinomycetota bacterium]